MGLFGCWFLAARLTIKAFAATITLTIIVFVNTIASIATAAATATATTAATVGRLFLARRGDRVTAGCTVVARPDRLVGRFGA